MSFSLEETQAPDMVISPQEAEAAAAPASMPVQPAPAQPMAAPAAAPSGGLGQQRQALMNERVDAANQTGDSFEREGEAKAAGASEAAQLYAGVAARADKFNRIAEERYGDHQERAAK